MPKKGWEREAERIGGDELLNVIKEIRTGQKDILKVLDEFDDRHKDAEMAIQKLYKAFPAGDVDGHRRYHELLIVEAEERRKLRVAIQEKTISALIWSGLVALGMAIWHEIQTRLLGR